jgi:hypothetical protein
MDLKCGQGVRVKWLDSASLPGWHYKDPTDADVSVIVSLGLVVGTKPQCLVLTSSLDDSGGAMDPLAIPWAAIQELNVLTKADF